MIMILRVLQSLSISTPANSAKTTILKEYPQEYIKIKYSYSIQFLQMKIKKKYNKYLEYSKEFDSLKQHIEDLQNINITIWMIWLKELWSFWKGSEVMENKLLLMTAHHTNDLFKEISKNFSFLFKWEKNYQILI